MALKVLDYTDLRENVHDDDFDAFIDKTWNYSDWLAAVCLPRKLAKLARAQINSSVKVTSVYNFPNGDDLVESVVKEIKADYDQIDEFDVVIPLAQPNFAETASFIRQVRKASEGRVLKIILETSRQSMRDIDILTMICMDNGVDFVKTSTGRREGTCIRDVSIILNRLYTNRYEQTGIKVSGGIKTVKQMDDFISIAELFDVPIQQDTFRIGSSSLLDDILKNSLSDNLLKGTY